MTDFFSLSGKTSTIVALIQLLFELNKNILITSHTHSAVDNVCNKLLEHNIKVLRLGSESKIDPKLQEYSEHRRTRHCKTPEELEKIYNDAVSRHSAKTIHFCSMNPLLPHTYIFVMFLNTIVCLKLHVI